MIIKCYYTGEETPALIKKSTSRMSARQMARFSYYKFRFQRVDILDDNNHLTDQFIDGSIRTTDDRRNLTDEERKNQAPEPAVEPEPVIETEQAPEQHADPLKRRAIKISDSAVMLGVTPVSIRRLLKNGTIKGLNILRHTLIPVSEIDRILNV
jgi:hypothetical protein